jgi:hypothetical protein
MILCFRKFFLEGLKQFRLSPGCKDCSTGSCQAAENCYNLPGGLSGAKYYLGKAAAQVSMVINTGKPKVFIGQYAQLLNRFLNARFTLLNRMQQFLKFCFVNSSGPLSFAFIKRIIPQMHFADLKEL